MLFVRFSFDQLFSFVYHFALAIGHVSFIVPHWRSAIFLLSFLAGGRPSFFYRSSLAIGYLLFNL